MTISFNIQGETINAPIDPTPWPIKDFERARDYFITTKDGNEYILTIAASGYVAHPVVRS